MVLKLQSITTFIFDMDGVLTDGNLLLDENGNWLRKMNLKDGYALQLAVKKGYHVVVMSGSVSEPVLKRLNYLGINDVRFKIDDKVATIQDIMLEYKIQKSNILFMGDDIPDLKAHDHCGIFCCPSDACQDVLDHAEWISKNPGGNGAVRDIIEKVMRAQDQWDILQSLSSI